MRLCGGSWLLEGAAACLWLCGSSCGVPVVLAGDQRGLWHVQWSWLLACTGSRRCAQSTLRRMHKCKWTAQRQQLPFDCTLGTGTCCGTSSRGVGMQSATRGMCVCNATTMVVLWGQYPPNLEIPHHAQNLKPCKTWKSSNSVFPTFPKFGMSASCPN